MPSYVAAVVEEVLSERPGLQRVRLAGGVGRAYALTELTGTVAVGDDVVVNTTAVELELGTGGWHIVATNLSEPTRTIAGRGHIMKARYTPSQIDAGAAAEHDPGLASAGADLDGLPVVVCGLHSQLGVVVALALAELPGIRIAYLMTDGAALPYALSDLAADLRARDLIMRSVTAGQSFGGDDEAVGPYDGLVIAGRSPAELVVVAMGPGVVGTGTGLGFSAMEVGTYLDAVERLGGVPIAALRWSDADERSRHRGLSHHSATALRLGTGATVRVPIPATASHDRMVTACEAAGLGDVHRVERVPMADPRAAMAALHLDIRSMGRGIDDDPAFYAAAGAAGALGARLARQRRGPDSSGGG